jgi:hypothetical protein
MIFFHLEILSFVYHNVFAIFTGQTGLIPLYTGVKWY